MSKKIIKSIKVNLFHFVVWHPLCIYLCASGKLSWLVYFIVFLGSVKVTAEFKV